MDSDPIGSVLGDPAKRRAAAQILGQAYLTARVLHAPQPRGRRAASPTRSSQRKELYGDEVVELLRARPTPSAPAIDVLDETIWPKV